MVGVIPAQAGQAGTISGALIAPAISTNLAGMNASADNGAGVGLFSSLGLARLALSQQGRNEIGGEWSSLFGGDQGAAPLTSSGLAANASGAADTTALAGDSAASWAGPSGADFVQGSTTAAVPATEAGAGFSGFAGGVGAGDLAGNLVGYTESKAGSKGNQIGSIAGSVLGTAIGAYFGVPYLGGLAGGAIGGGIGGLFADGGGTGVQGAIQANPGPAGRVLGSGDGRSDQVPAMLSRGEHVIPADVVSAIGRGSSDAGSDAIDQWILAQRARYTKHLGVLPPPAK